MRKGLLKLTALLIVAVFTITVAYATDKKDYTLTIDGEVMASEVYEDNGTVMLPLRAICERLGFNVQWDNETRTVVLEKLPVYVTFNVDSDGYTFARTAPMLLGKAPMIVSGRTYVPSNFIDEILQGEIEIDGKNIDILWLQEAEAEDVYENVTFIEIDETGRLLVNNFLRGEMLLNVSDETVIKNEAGETLKISDITTERELKVKLSPAMTMSLPPQVNALEIVVLDKLAPVVKTGVVSEVLEEEGVVKQIVIGKFEDGEGFFAINVSEETKVYNIDGDEVKLSDVKEGSKISANVSATSTMSIPPQFGGFALRIVE